MSIINRGLFYETAHTRINKWSNRYKGMPMIETKDKIECTTLNDADRLAREIKNATNFAQSLLEAEVNSLQLSPYTFNIARSDMIHIIGDLWCATLSHPCSTTWGGTYSVCIDTTEIGYIVVDTKRDDRAYVENTFKYCVDSNTAWGLDPIQELYCLVGCAIEGEYVAAIFIRRLSVDPISRLTILEVFDRPVRFRRLYYDEDRLTVQFTASLLRRDLYAPGEVTVCGTRWPSDPNIKVMTKGESVDFIVSEPAQT